MRLAIFSDIHGNLAALEAVLADIEAHGPFDALGVAGDLCEWGPQPREVLQRVRALGCPVVQGNTDRNVTIADDAKLRAMGKSEHAIAALAWTRAQIGDEGVAYLATVPFAHTYTGPDGQDVLMVHANPIDQDTPLGLDAPAEFVARVLGATTAAVMAFGHVHIPYVRVVAGRLLVDVASVGYPCDGNRAAVYATLTWGGTWRAAIHRVSYDLAATAAAFDASGIPRPRKRIRALYRATE